MGGQQNDLQIVSLYGCFWVYIHIFLYLVVILFWPCFCFLLLCISKLLFVVFDFFIHTYFQTNWKLLFKLLLRVGHQLFLYWVANKMTSKIPNCFLVSSRDFRNFVQSVPIPLWKNFESFRFISSVSGCFGKYQFKFKIWPKKKKKNLKTKTNLHYINQKTSKEKKKKWTKVHVQ